MSKHILDNVHPSQRPSSSMQHTVEATSTAPISTTTRHTQEPEIAPFRLLDLPRELRDCIYSFMVASSRSYHELTGQPSDWFNPAILNVNHQVHKEASEAISKTEIKILLNYHTIKAYSAAQWRSTSPEQWAISPERLSILSERLPFERYNIHLDLPLPNTGRHDTFVQWLYQRRAQDLIEALITDLQKMPQLEQLRIEFVPPVYVLTKGTLKDFARLSGLRKVTITGLSDHASIDRLVTGIISPKATMPAQSL